MYPELTQKYGVESISAQDAYALCQAGEAVLVDVRPVTDHESSAPAGAANAPMFRIIDIKAGGGGIGRLLKFVAMKTQGVTPTEQSPDFLSSVAAVAGSKTAILACEAGGTLEPTVNFPIGKESRSLKAAWRVASSNTLPPSKIKHLQGGVLGWYKAELPMTGEYDTSKAYRTPQAAEQPSGEFFQRKK
jgi:rhodanese-related sulfurtransferase